MKKIIAIFALFMFLQIPVLAADTTSAKFIGKLGRILNIMTEDEKTTVESEKSGLKKVSDYLNSVDGTATNAANTANTKLNELKELQTAIKNNDKKAVLKYLTKDNVNEKTSTGATLLSLAVANDNSEIIKLLLNYGADINAKDKAGDTQTSIAAALGKINALKTLIGSGADIKETNNKGWTALHAAVAANQLAAVNVLIAAGADVNAASPMGITPLTLATAMKRTEIKEVLIKAGAVYLN